MVPNNIGWVPNSVETGYLFRWVPILDSSRSRQLERWPRRRQAGGGRHNDVVHDTAGNVARGWQDLLWDDRPTAGAAPGSHGCLLRSRQAVQRGPRWTKGETQLPTK